MTTKITHMRLGPNGMEEIVPAQVKVGSVIQLHHTVDRIDYVVTDIIEDTVHTVKMDEKEPRKQILDRHRIMPIEKKFGIGFYHTGEVVLDKTVVNLWKTDSEDYMEKLARKEKLARENAEKAKNKAQVLGEQRLKDANIDLERYKNRQGSYNVIVAELVEDDSDPMTDYFGCTHIETVILGFSTNNRNNFAEMRKVAGLSGFKPVAHLVKKNKEYERRENYSGGHSYYLKDSYYNSTGWMIRKDCWMSKDQVINLLGAKEDFFLANYSEKKRISFFVENQNDSEKNTPVKVSSEGPRIELNTEKGGIELYFDEKPNSDVLSELKDHSFRWNRYKKCWYCYDNPDNRALIISMFNISF
jgi:hypothetical protein